MSLRVRIYLLVALAVAPAFALLILDHSEDIQTQETQAEQRALHDTLLVSAELDQVFKGFEILLRTAAQIPALRNFDEPACSEVLFRLKSVNPNAGAIAVVDREGNARCGELGLAVSDRDYFRLAIESDSLVVGSYTIGRVTGTPILPLALRFPAADGPAVIIAGVRIDWLRAHFAQRFKQFPEHSSLTIVDRNGVMVVRLPNSDREGETLLNYREVVSAGAPGTFRSDAARNADGIARFLGYAPLSSPPQGLAVAVGFPQRPLLAQIDANARRNYMLLGATALLTFLAAVIGGRLFIQRPLDHLLRVIDRWRHRDTSARVALQSGHTEFGRLGHEFNRLADELESALNYKDVMLRELNHRIMNSLHTISSLMRLQRRSIQEPVAARHLDQAILRIETIALAYQRMQAARGVETFDFTQFLRELCRDFETSMMSPGANCTVVADDLQLPPEQAIALSLVANELLTNAIKHGGTEGPITVKLRDGFDCCRFAVRNRGDLPPGYDPAKSQGFGLRMVQSAATQLHGEFTVHGEDGEIECAVCFHPDKPVHDLAPATQPEVPGTQDNAASLQP